MIIHNSTDGLERTIINLAAVHSGEAGVYSLYRIITYSPQIPFGNVRSLVCEGLPLVGDSAQPIPEMLTLSPQRG